MVIEFETGIIYLSNTIASANFRDTDVKETFWILKNPDKDV